MTDFAGIGVRPRTADTLNQHGITVPNPVQITAVPPLLEGRDVVIESPTGSGKTLAFGIPLIERLQGHRRGGARALIVTPTRELTQQVASVIKKVDAQLRVAVIVGGVGYGPQRAVLARDPDVIVGCPGRLLDLAGQGCLELGAVTYLVLDEADEMLDQGFARDVERIMGLCPSGLARPQTVLASATMPAWVQTMIAKHLVDPARVRVVADAAESTLEHGVLRVRHDEKLEVLSTLLTGQRKAGSQTIVFHRTKHGAKKLARDLVRRGFTAVELQGNLSQNARDRAIGAFRSADAEVMVATNVAARGIDVASVGLVINAELPETAQWLTHRVGRTARNGAAGRAITFLSELDGEQWSKLQRTGAPRLLDVSREPLLQDGSWSLVAPAAPPRETVARPGGDRTGTARRRPRRRRGPARSYAATT